MPVNAISNYQLFLIRTTEANLGLVREVHWTFSVHKYASFSFVPYSFILDLIKVGEKLHVDKLAKQLVQFSKQNDAIDYLFDLSWIQL